MCAVAWLCGSAAFAHAQAAAPANPGGPPPPYVWKDIDGNALPFQDADAIIEFMRSAEIESVDDIELGVTNPRKVVLHRDGVRLHAALRDYDETFNQRRFDGIFYPRLRDSFMFDVPAYNLSRLLDLNNIPPVTFITIGGQRVSLQIWMEGAVMESGRIASGEKPPSQQRFHRLTQDMRVFDSVIGNVDRNTGNILWDDHHEAWLIDHSRAFMRNDETRYLERITNCSRWLYDGLKALTLDELLPIMTPALTRTEVEWVLRRRDKVIAYIDARIEERGGNDQTVLLEGRE